MLVPIRNQAGAVIAEALVDDADASSVLGHAWHLSQGYARTQVPLIPRVGRRRQRPVYMHVMIAETPIGMVTDHVDGNRLNNSRANLRVCTYSQNAMNKRATSASGHKGVSWHAASGKWMARVGVGGISRFLGVFPCPKQASDAYWNAAQLLHGEYASRGSV